jgi:N-acetylmuramoyl-L-alanine amidase
MRRLQLRHNLLIQLCIAAWILLLVIPQQASALTPIQLYLNGKKLTTEVAPRIINDIAVVPVRIIAEELGAEVKWEGETRKVNVVQNQVSINLQIDNDQATVNGSAKKLDIPPMIVDGSTMLPLRFVGENLGMHVTWDPRSQSVYLFRAEEDVNTSQTSSVPITEEKLAAADTKPVTGSSTNQSQGSTAADQIIKQTRPINLAESGKPQPTGQKTGLTQIQIIDEQIELHTGVDVTPSFFYLENPDRLVIDLPGVSTGATVNGKPAVQNGQFAVDHPTITLVRYAVFSHNPLITRVVIDLNKRLEYEVVAATGGIAVLKPKSIAEPEPEPPPKRKVFIDAGHGGTDIGAPTISNRYEKDFTLPLSNKVYELLKLEPTIEPIVTRTSDITVELDERVALANASGAELFLSIHGNSYKENRNIRGTETYYSRSDSVELAKIIHRHVLEASSFPDRKVKSSKFKVLRETTMPAVLLEVGFLSNSTEEKQMFLDEFQQRVATALVEAIKEYLQNN